MNCVILCEVLHGIKLLNEEVLKFYFGFKYVIFKHISIKLLTAAKV